METDLNFLVIIAIIIATVICFRIKKRSESRDGKPNLKKSERALIALAKLPPGRIYDAYLKQDISAENIPPRLRVLQPLLYQWCIGDDAIRADVMDQVDKKVKHQLIDAVSPYLMDINDFLDSFGDEAMTNEAILLSNLAELVCELKIDA